MNRMHKTRTALMFAVALTGVTAHAAPITYYVDQTVGIGSVTGSIVTDGALGMLESTHIAGWNLHVNNGAESFDLDSANSHLFGSGRVTASAQQLTYDFSSGNYFGFFLNTSVPGDRTAWCLQSLWGQCSFSGVSGESVGVHSANYTDLFRDMTGTQVIASVPEPETYGMMLAGLGLLGLLRRRRSTPAV